MAREVKIEGEVEVGMKKCCDVEMEKNVKLLGEVKWK
jgi:hypothetical protein